MFARYTLAAAGERFETVRAGRTSEGEIGSTIVHAPFHSGPGRCNTHKIMYN